MRVNEYFNTLHGVSTDGRKIWDETMQQEAFMIKRKNQPYFRIKGKLVSRSQLFDSRYIIKQLPKKKLLIKPIEYIGYLFDVIPWL